MKLLTTRTAKDLNPVLENSPLNNSDVIYMVYTELDEKLQSQGWVNKTVLKPGRLGEQYTKTFGHYHTHPIEELYRVEEGEGILLLQKKHHEDGTWTPDLIDEVLLVQAKAGDEILITPEYGHSWSNVGNSPLVLLDNWNDGHTPDDYEQIQNHQGMAYYIVEEDGKPHTIPNPTYKRLPKPIWINAEDLHQDLGRYDEQ